MSNIEKVAEKAESVHTMGKIIHHSQGVFKEWEFISC
jgi:hypothetical protein